MITGLIIGKKESHHKQLTINSFWGIFILVKAILRAQYRSLRRTFPEPLKKKASQEIFEKLSSLLPFFPFVASFCSFDDEIDLSAFNYRLSLEKRLFLPRRIQKNLHFCLVDDLSSLRGNNLKEPVSSPVPLPEGTLILVPGLAFSSECMRLGYGFGYYDRFLEKYAHYTSVGVGFLFQLTNSLPQDPWDRSVSHLILV